MDSITGIMGDDLGGDEESEGMICFSTTFLLVVMIYLFLLDITSIMD